MTRSRARELGVACGRMQTGEYNAITDVAGVKVGHSTIKQGEACTGVTAVLPHSGNLFQEKVAAAATVLNGFGKAIGLSQIAELGQIETPILLTSTLAAPKAADALISWMIARDGSITSLNPVVGECNDSFLNDIQARAVSEEHVFHALDFAASGAVLEGAVGGGSGMTAFGYKGGIGTASRMLPPELGGFTVGLLVMANFGSKSELLIAGVPVGQILSSQDESESVSPVIRADGNIDGSIMMILATDAPLSSRQLGRLAKRVPLGLARTGSVASHGSGDYVIAFSTARRVLHKRPSEEIVYLRQALYEDGSLLTPLFTAAVEATEEAIYNALFMAETTIGYKGRSREALPLDRVTAILREYGRLSLS